MCLHMSFYVSLFFFLCIHINKKKANKESEKDLKCPHCDKLCLNKTGLANHIRKLHTTVSYKT